MDDATINLLMFIGTALSLALLILYVMMFSDLRRIRKMTEMGCPDSNQALIRQAYEEAAIGNVQKAKEYLQRAEHRIMNAKGYNDYQRAQEMRPVTECRAELGIE